MPSDPSHGQARSRHRLAIWYFCAQAVAVTAWWALLAAVPASRPFFTIRGAPFVALGAFAVGDLGLVAVGSAIVAWHHGRGASTPVAWCVAGAMVYAAAYTATTAVVGASAPVSAFLMIPAAAGSLAAAAALSRDAAPEPVSPRATT